MVEPKVDMEFVQESWEEPRHISAYADEDRFRGGKLGGDGGESISNVQSFLMDFIQWP